MTNVARCTPLQSLAVAHGAAAITRRPDSRIIFLSRLLSTAPTYPKHKSRCVPISGVKMTINVQGTKSTARILFQFLWYDIRQNCSTWKAKLVISCLSKWKYNLCCLIVIFTVLSQFTHFCVEQTFTWKSLSVEHKSKNDKYHASRFQNKTILENEVFDSAEKTTLFGPNVHTLKVFRKGKKSNVDIYIFF